MLVRTPEPYSTESLLGYLLRVSSLNGYDSPNDILYFLEGSDYRLSVRNLPLKKLAVVLKQKLSLINGISYGTSVGGLGYVKILNHELGKQVRLPPLRIKNPMICPMCIKEKGFIDAFWDLSVAVACPNHRCLTVMQCPNCGKALSWRRLGLVTCSCGANLSLSEEIIAEESLVCLMKVVYHKLYGMKLVNSMNLAAMPIDQLCSLPLNSLLKLISNLGHFYLISNYIEDSSDSLRIVKGAAEVLKNWPHSYHSLLQNLGNRYLSERPSAAGIRKQFEPFYGAMFNASFSKDISFLREEFVNFGLNHWGKGTVDKKLFRSMSYKGEQRFLSKSEFARRFRIWKPVMDRLIKEGVVTVEEIRVADSKRVVVDLKHSQVPVESFGLVTNREVAVYIGLPVSVISCLRDMGIYSTKIRAGHAKSWYQDDAEYFLDRGLALAKKIEGNFDGAVSLKKLMRLTLRSATAKADIVAGIFDGRLTVLGRTGNKLSSLMLDKTEVDSFVLNKRVEQGSNSYSFPEAFQQTGIDPMAIQSALDLGLLKQVNCDGRIRVTVESVDSFNANYITLSNKAKELKTSSKRLGALCQKYDVPTISLSRCHLGIEQLILPKKYGESLQAAHYKTKRRQDKSREYKQKRTDLVRSYETSLLDYLSRLKESGGRLPRRKTLPMKVAIADACGFNRDVLYSYPTVIQILERYDSEEHQLYGIDSRDNLRKLQDYLEELEKRGRSLPCTSRGEPHKSAIAKECGFDRNFFYSNKKAIELIQEKL